MMSSSALGEPSKSLSPTGPYSARDKKFERVLSAPIVNLRELEKIVWSGCPSNLRPVCWKLLLVRESNFLFPE
jgi:hypothetical protein